MLSEVEADKSTFTVRCFDYAQHDKVGTWLAMSTWIGHGRPCPY